MLIKQLRISIVWKPSSVFDAEDWAETESRFCSVCSLFREGAALKPSFKCAVLQLKVCDPVRVLPYVPGVTAVRARRPASADAASDGVPPGPDTRRFLLLGLEDPDGTASGRSLARCARCDVMRARAGDAVSARVYRASSTRASSPSVDPFVARSGALHPRLGSHFRALACFSTGKNLGGARAPRASPHAPRAVRSPFTPLLHLQATTTF